MSFWNGLINSPLGEAELRIDSKGIRYLGFGPLNVPPNGEGRPSLALEVQAQLDEYFSGSRRIFDLPICLTGTNFRTLVWERLLAIPYGQTISYSQLAVELGSHLKTRAVGGAVGQNPIAIIVPCHRVTGKGGSLTGYAGGVWRKAELLKLEMPSLFRDSFTGTFQETIVKKH